MSIFDYDSKRRQYRRISAAQQIVDTAGNQVNLVEMPHTETGEAGWFIPSYDGIRFRLPNGGYEYGQRLLWMNIHPFEIQDADPNSLEFRYESWNPDTQQMVDCFSLNIGSYTEIDYPMAFMGGSPPNPLYRGDEDVDWAMAVVRANEDKSCYLSLKWSDVRGGDHWKADDNQMSIGWKTY